MRKFASALNRFTGFFQGNATCYHPALGHMQKFYENRSAGSIALKKYVYPFNAFANFLIVFTNKMLPRRKGKKEVVLTKVQCIS